MAYVTWGLWSFVHGQFEIQIICPLMTFTFVRRTNVASHYEFRH
jgi:hypothetical protein